MWNPDTYVDTDFGLDDGESFEPDDAWEPEPFDTSLPHLMTVLGPISPDNLGITQVHEYLSFEASGVAASGADSVPPGLAIVRDELEFFVTAGGGSMVDAATPDTGRNLDGLLTLAQLAPVNLIATAGRGRDAYAATMPGAGDEEFMFEELLADLQSPVKPGILAFAVGDDRITPIERANARAVARVAAETGYPVRAGMGSGAQAMAVLDLVEKSGLDARRVIVGQVDWSWSADVIADVANRGSWLAFDRVGQGGPDEDRARAAAIVRLAEAGFGDRLLVSQGLSSSTEYISQGGRPGWIHLIEWFTLALMDAGADAMLVRNLLIENPANALTIDPPDADHAPGPL